MISSETNGAPEYRRERGIFYTNTKIGNSTLSSARSGFDADRFKGMQVREWCYPVVDSEAGAVMSLVRFGDPWVRCGRRQCRGAHWWERASSVRSSRPRMGAEIHAFWVPSAGRVQTPWASGTVPVRDW